MTTEGTVQVVEVRNFDMTFGRMVWFMVKWAFASIPALLILIVAAAITLGLARGVFLGIVQSVQQARSTPSATDNYEPSYSPSTAEYQPLPPPPPLPSVESEITKAQQLLADGHYMQAYGVAHATALRVTAKSSEGRTLQAIREKAWQGMQNGR